MVQNPNQPPITPQKNKKLSIPLRTIRHAMLFTASMVLVFVFGYWAGIHGLFSYWYDSNALPGVNIVSNAGPRSSGINTFVKADKDLGLFWEVWGRMEDKYIDRDELNTQDMIYGAIKGMVAAAGDPYTTFLTPDENKRSQEDLQGEFSGVGIQLGYKDDPETSVEERQLSVVAPLEGMPAQSVGVLAGDLILAVDGQSTVGMSIPEAVDLIRGPKGSQVTLTLYTEGDDDTHDIAITRDTIEVESVTLKFVEDQGNRVAHLRVSRFGEKTQEEILAAGDQILEEWNKGAITGIVLDLRGNPGGYFQRAIDMVSEFVPSGVVVQQEDAYGNKQQFRANGSGRLKDIPLVVLVDQGSASSSEITAGALRDLKQVPLVGKTTFGKGTVQSAEDLPDGSGIHITTHRWLLPSGANIHKEGVAPDYEVDYVRPESEGQLDPQIIKAIEVVSQE